MDGTGKHPRWPMVKLGDVCEMFIDGDWIESKDQSETGLRLIQTGNIGVGVFKNRVEKARYITENTFSKLKCTEVLHGDCLVSRLPDPVGRACIVPDTGERMITSVDCSILRLKKNLIFDKYLILYTQTEKYAYDISKKTSGSTRTRISRTNLGEITLPLPPLTEQQRIVARLDAAFAAIDEASAAAASNARNARALFESYLDQVFSQRGAGWVERRLGEVALDFGRGKSKHRPRNSAILFGGKYPFIQTGDIRNANHVVTEYSQTYNDIGLAQSKLWPKGTICITIAANIAETAVLGFDACFPDSIIGLVVDTNQADTEFVEYMLQHYKSHLQSLSKGSAQANINLGTFEDTKFYIPDIVTQNQVIIDLKELDNQALQLTTIYERKVAALAELKQSLLAEVFGE